MHGTQTIQLSQCHTKFLMATGVQDNHITLLSTKSLIEGILARLQVGEIIAQSALFQLAAQAESKVPFLAGGVITVNDYRMIVLKLRYKGADAAGIEIIRILIHLIDVLVGVERRRRDGERDKQLDVVRLNEF